MNKFPVVKCPYCFRKLMYNNAVFRCKSGEQRVDSYLKTYNIEKGKLAFEQEDYGYIDPADLHKNQIELDSEGRIIGVEDPNKAMRQPLQQRLCPYCHNELLKSFGKNNTRFIAVVGVPNSGKTTFLAAVNHSLKQKTWNWGSLDAEKSRPLDTVTNMYANGEANARVATKEIQGPYFYRLNYSNSVNTESSEEHIVFFDVPGEFYTSAEKINENLSLYLSEADGIIFIVNSAEELEHKEAQEKGEYGNLVNVNDVLDAFNQAGIISNKKVAIVFNKLDRVKGDIGIDNLQRFLPPPTDFAVDTAQIASSSEAIAKLMLGDGAAIQNDIQRALSSYMKKIQLVFGNDISVFATRLLVEEEDKYYFRSEGAETPLLWLLSEIGGFPKKTEN